jgi:low affinity Fe/Cu permease
MRKSLNRLLTRVGVGASRPGAFAIVALYAVLWMIFDVKTFDWHAIATMITWLMTIFIQRAEHRDTQAIHAKIDELLRTSATARNSLTRLDEAEPEDIERHRVEERRD